MAYLLGAAAVMESLQSDVRDVQSCVADIISRVGPVQFTSWKFPDKTASDLDIEDLLDLYSYSDDAEERQVAHIALYELVIDRLLLLMQTMAVYTDRILKVAKSNSDSEPGTSTSVGLVVKKYWTRLSHIHTVVKQTVHEKNEFSRKVSDLEGDVSRLNLELKQSYNKNRPRTAGFGGLIPQNRAEMITGLSLDPSQLQQFGLLAKDEYNKSCQTSETAFTPCTSCSVVQKSFRQSGEIIINICQQQQIPSCLQKFRPHVSHLDWLSGTDVSRWANEQNKDLQRISKLTTTIKPLKDELSECNTKCDKLSKRVANFDHDLRREKDERTLLNRNYDLKLKDLESQHSKTLELEQQQRDLLYHNKQELENVLERHKSDLAEKQTLLKGMETTKSKLENELSSNKTNISEVKRLEREMSGLHERLDDISGKMERSAKELQREQAKNKSASKHSQSLQSKHAALLQRVDDLDQDNVDLRDQVSALEEEKDCFEDSLREVKRETTPLQKNLREREVEIAHVNADKESLEQTISTLETSLEKMKERLTEAQERERLIVEYPDVNGPVNPDLTGTGDIVVDMDNQVKANNVRIELLEKQNEGLRNSISKLIILQGPRQPQTQGGGQGQWATYVQTTAPQPLWNPNFHNQQQEQANPPAKMAAIDNISRNDNQSAHKTNYGTYNQSKETESRPKSQPGVQVFEFDQSSMQKHRKQPTNERPAFEHRPLTGNKSKHAGDEFVVGKTSRPTTGSSSRSRPSSGKAFMASVNASSISAYLQMKKAGKLNLNTNSASPATGSRPTPSKPSIPTADQDYSHQENFTCEHCDKMYTRHRDLEIHKSYCTC